MIEQIFTGTIENKMEKEITKNCHHCGASMKSYFHALSTGLVSCLVIAIKFVNSHNKNEFHLQRDLKDLSKSQYNNFQKLRFHGLVAKVDNKDGYWLITRRGGQFLRGEIEIPKSVETFRNGVLGHSKETVHIKSLKNKIPYFESEFAYEYQRLDSIKNLEQTLF